jgi:putative addiction module component (TIGR02574 family)
MDNDPVISVILAMPLDTQKAIWKALQPRFQGELSLTPKQEKELKQRLDRFDRGEFQGAPWEAVEKRLRKVIKHARDSRRYARSG